MVWRFANLPIPFPLMSGNKLLMSIPAGRSFAARLDGSLPDKSAVHSIGRLKNFFGFSKVTFSISSLFKPNILIARITLGTEK